MGLKIIKIVAMVVKKTNSFKTHKMRYNFVVITFGYTTSLGINLYLNLVFA